MDTDHPNTDETKHSNKDKCAICAANEYQDNIGQPLCKSCNEVGFQFVTTGIAAKNHDNSSDCQKPVGTGVTTCPGAQRRNSAAQCEDCPQGYHGDGDGVSCLLCPSGFFQDQEAQQKCKKCSFKLCTLAPGATSDAATTPDSLTLRLPKSDDDSASDFGDDGSDTSASTTTSQDDATNTKSTFSTFTGQIGVQPERLAIYILCALLGLLVILFHRNCPDKIKALDMFSEKHVVEDSHALRNLGTRLGASFTLALIFVVGAIFAFITDPANNFVEISGLEPGTVDRLPNASLGRTSYQHVTIVAKTFAARTKAINCAEIEHTASSKGFKVTSDDKPVETIFEGVGIECSFVFKCTVSSSIRGMTDFMLTMPETFQWMEWSVESSYWSPNHRTSRFGSILTTNSTTDRGQVLAGTPTDPTTLTFGAIRSSHFDDFKNITKFALQLFWRGTGKILKTTTDSSRKHTVAFRFEVEENVYVSELRKKLNFSSMLSVSERMVFFVEMH
jgi:hypothetical protein